MKWSEVPCPAPHNLQDTCVCGTLKPHRADMERGLLFLGCPHAPATLFPPWVCPLAATGTPFRVHLQTARALLEPQGVEQQGVTEGRWVWAVAPTPLFRRPCAVFLSVLSHHKPGPQESEAGDERTAHSRSSENVGSPLSRLFIESFNSWELARCQAWQPSSDRTDVNDPS